VVTVAVDPEAVSTLITRFALATLPELNRMLLPPLLALINPPLLNLALGVLTVRDAPEPTVCVVDPKFIDWPAPWALNETAPAVPPEDSMLSALMFCEPLKVSAPLPAVRVMVLVPVPAERVAEIVPLPLTTRAPALVTFTLLTAESADVVIVPLFVSVMDPEVLLASNTLPVAAAVLIVPLLVNVEPPAPVKVILPFVLAVLDMLPLFVKVSAPAAVTDTLPTLAEVVSVPELLKVRALLLPTEMEPVLPETLREPLLVKELPFIAKLIGLFAAILTPEPIRI
jgi:hypothetical protein